MQFLLFLLEVVKDTPADALPAKGGPFLQKAVHPQHPWGAADEDVKVAGKAVLQGGHAEQLLHQLIRVHPPLQVDGELEAGKVGLVPDVGNFPHLPRLHQLHRFVHDGFHRGGGGDFGDVHTVASLIVGVAASHPHRATAGGVNLLQLRRIVEDKAAAGEVRGLQGLGNGGVRVPQPGDGGFAHLQEVKGTDIAGHPHGDAGVGVGEDGGEGDREQHRLLHLAVVVIHKVHCVPVNLGKQLLAHLFQLGLGVPGGGGGHIPAVGLAEVPLALHIGHQQRPVAPGEADHGLVDGLVPVGV